MGTDSLAWQSVDTVEETVALPSPVGRLTTTLQADVHRLVTNWALRVANLPAFRATPDLDLMTLRDVIPDVLSAVLIAVEAPEPDLNPEPIARAAESAAAHGAARATAGFSLRALLEEYHQLWAVIWDAIWKMEYDPDDFVAALRDMQPRLSATFQIVTIAAAEGWATTSPHRETRS